MSKLTRSIFFSGTVLAAGMVAIFSIYGNTSRTSTGAESFTSIEPAAGIETTMVDTMSEMITEIYAETSTEITTEISGAVQNIQSELTEAGLGIDIDAINTDPIGEEASATPITIDHESGTIIPISTELVAGIIDMMGMEMASGADSVELDVQKALTAEAAQAIIPAAGIDTNVNTKAATPMLDVIEPVSVGVDAATTAIEDIMGATH